SQRLTAKGRGFMRLAVIGLDCATPQLVFDRFRRDLPNLGRLMDEGAWGLLESTHPPITVPAWASMMSGYDPGQLGIYGFRNRKDHSYDQYVLPSASTLKVDRVWDVLSRAGKKVILLGVPQTYPIKPVNGCVVSDFLTPSTRHDYTYPAELKAEVERVAGGYVFDVEDFRTEDKAALLERIYDKTRKHFAVANHFLRTKPWDFFMLVEMGVDRIHHGFWSYMDPTHPNHVPGNPFEGAIREYYRYVDRQVGEVLDLLPEDTVVLVVSDHGAKKLDGGFCFNEWLVREGYLTVKAYPKEITPIDRVEIDWSRTSAWGDGGYYGRVFLNVRGREPQGTIDPRDYEKVRTELVEKIQTIENPQGRSLGSKAYRPEALYREVNGVAPDLIVYFGDLDWRSIGSLGFQTLYTFDNDTGPDGANHDWHGIFVMNGLGCEKGSFRKGRHDPLKLYDIGPTVLAFFGLQPSVDGVGRPMIPILA
ncbi:MAG: alkaline phosphatase family protein, partial [Candidatus Methylomirabilis sp.]